ncbi:MAG: S24 family peptidase [Desulfovibrio sp.]|nr:S24 family peptidase [Desulfovibrio sp.]
MGTYKDYLNGVRSLFEGEGARFKNRSELAGFVDLAPAQIGRYTSEEGTKNLEKICDFLDKVGAKIVFPGQEMDGFVLIPRVRGVAGAGESWETSAEPTGMYAFRESFMRNLGLNAKHAIMMYVAGDSMEPLICNRDTILVDTHDTEPRDGGIHVVGFGETVMVKRLQRTPRGWNLCSENKRYPPLAIEGQELESMRIHGRVRWFGRVL